VALHDNIGSRSSIWRSLSGLYSRAAGPDRVQGTGIALLCVVVVFAAIGPILFVDPSSINPSMRLLPPSAATWLGTDHLGRDVLSRLASGARVSLSVGFFVAVISVAVGTLIGLAAGYFKAVEAIVMRIMDGLMAIPTILLAIALASVGKAGIGTVIIAIIIPEIPRVVRLVRSVVLGAKELPYVEAAISYGLPHHWIILRHVLPVTLPPLLVQGTYIFATAILIEASLSFLGAGMPPERPSWGNMIAEGRLFLTRAPWTIFAPGLLLALVVLAINLVGDSLRDALDPKTRRLNAGGRG